MPISGGVVYAVQGDKSDSEIGDAPSAGLIKLCQMGDPSVKTIELRANTNVKWIANTSGPLLPGQKVTIDVGVPNEQQQSLHFVAMYGKSKELCSAIDVSSHAPRTLRYSDEIIQTDSVLNAGAFADPVIPSGSTSELCAGATNAIGCLRSLSSQKTGMQQIHYFSGYLPSVIDFLEIKYGAEDVLSLILPHSGAVKFSLKRK
jgi:hypothetical protein